MKNKIAWSIAVLSLAVCSIPVLLNVGAPAIYMWDEATYANNAIDMYETHDLLVVRSEGSPDLYNTKPPLVIWLQALAMNFFGINEFSVRIPSAMFCIFTMVILLWFAVSVMDSLPAGIIAMLTLTCSNGYISNHGARSGDLDAALVFWVSLYIFTFLKWLIRERKKSSDLVIAAIAVAGAFLTKGIAGFFFLPFLALIALFNGQLRQLIRLKEFYFSAIAVVIICTGYYLLRETVSPGYLKILYDSELSRYGNAVMSWHVEPFGFYLSNFFEGRFMPFLFFLPLSIIALLISKNGLMRRLIIYLLVLSFGYLLFISIPAVKLEWYDEPLYPLFSLLIGISFAALLEAVGNIRVKKNSHLLFTTVSMIIVITYFFAYKKIIVKVKAKDDIHYSWDNTQTDVFRIHGAYVKYLHDSLPAIKKYSVFRSLPQLTEHEDQLKFYTRSYDLSEGFQVNIVHAENQLTAPQLVAVAEKNQLDSLQNDFDLAVINRWNGCDLLLLKNKK